MNDSFLINGQPDLGCLIQAFNRCQPPMTGGLEWLDQVRNCNGPGDSFDGRKHADPTDPDSKAFPWENASNCKPFTADDVINELTARNVVAFWRAMIQRGAGSSDEAAYAVALVEYLVFGPMLHELDKETELSAQFMLGRGWCLLAPRWKQELGRKRYELKLATIQALSTTAAQQLAQLPPDADPMTRAALERQAQFVSVLLDPTREAEAKDLLREWYDRYTRSSLPSKWHSRLPAVTDKMLTRALKGLRSEEQSATVAIPYLCKNGLEISALEPWREVCLPNEFTDAQELVFQLEYLTPTTLEGRVLGEGYDRQWVDEAKKKTKDFDWTTLPQRSQPQGVSALLGQSAPAAGQTITGENKLVCIVHAVYKALDEDGVPGIYCTTFHPELLRETGAAPGRYFVGKHEQVDAIENQLHYVELVHEWRTRAITASRSVCEMVATDQKLIKDTFDQIVDRGSITILPPINVYEAPTGASYAISGPAIGDLQFGPGAQNRFRRKEAAAEFMQPPTGQGMADGVEVYRVVQSKVNNRFGLMSDDVPAPRMQILQERAVRRFLIGWTRAFMYGLQLWQKHGDDAEFARITGAPPGWLEERRDQPGALSSIFDFDVRELDAEAFIAQIEAMEKTVIPNDTLNVVDRARYTAWKARGIVGPRVARDFLRSLPDASTALREKAELQVLKMYAGTPPLLLDKDDPSAAGLLEATRATVLGNPKFVKALTPEALQAVAGDRMPLVLDQIKQAGMKPQPDALFSNLLGQWVENLTFIGVTQQRNKQIGRTGVEHESSNP